MDREEARKLLAERLKEYRNRSYAELVASIDKDEYLEVTGLSGTEYQIEVQFLWDGQDGGNVLVSAGIDDGSLRGAFSPVSENFIVTPDGRSLGE